MDLRQLYNHARIIYSAPAGWNAWGWGALALCSMVILGSFAADESLRLWFATTHTPILDELFDLGHWFGTGRPTLILFAALYGTGLLFAQPMLRERGLLIGESYLLSGILTITTKSLLGRWRPYTNHGSFAFLPFTAGPNEHLSLPSGHATVAFALSSVMAGCHSNKLWKTSWYLLALNTATSRIYHDDHWFSDVVCSALIGTAVGMWLIKNQRNNPLAIAGDHE